MGCAGEKGELPSAPKGSETLIQHWLGCAAPQGWGPWRWGEPEAGNEGQKAQRQRALGPDREEMGPTEGEPEGRERLAEQEAKARSGRAMRSREVGGLQAGLRAPAWVPAHRHVGDCERVSEGLGDCHFPGRRPRLLVPP